MKLTCLAICIAVLTTLPHFAFSEADVSADLGLQTCSEHILLLDEYQELRILPGHLMTTSVESRIYYINGTHTVDGTTHVWGFVCTTTLSGSEITALRQFDRDGK